MKSVWGAAYENINKVVSLQARYYNQRHKMIEFRVRDLILLNTVNLGLKGVSGKLRKKLIGPFRVMENIGTQSYKLQIPRECKLHHLFYISLLKNGMSPSIWKSPVILRLTSWRFLTTHCMSSRRYRGGENDV